jgi:hypothetical protein
MFPKGFVTNVTRFVVDRDGQNLFSAIRLYTILPYINCNSRQIYIFSLQITSWISNGISLLTQISKPLDVLRARLLLTSYCKGLQDYACISKDCTIVAWGLVPNFDLRICHIQLVYWQVFDLLAPPYMPFAVLSCYTLTEEL